MAMHTALLCDFIRFHLRALLRCALHSHACLLLCVRARRARRHLHAPTPPPAAAQPDATGDEIADAAADAAFAAYDEVADAELEQQRRTLGEPLAPGPCPSQYKKKPEQPTKARLPAAAVPRWLPLRLVISQSTPIPGLQARLPAAAAPRWWALPTRCCSSAPTSSPC